MKNTLFPQGMACVLLSTGVAFAQQTPPDAGQILQQVTPPASALPQGGQAPRVPAPAPTQTEPGGPEVSITELRFSGNTVFDSAQLQAVVAAEVGGDPLDMAGLEKLADRISAYYRAAGYPFATAFLPEQRLDDGLLTIEIIEGRYGRVQVQGEHEVRVRQAQRYLDQLVPGQVIAGPPLERATLLLNDLPGVQADAVLSPGQADGEGDLTVSLLPDARTYSLEAGVDNHGGYYSGLWRTRAILSVNSPFMLGDQFTAQGLHTDSNLWMGSLNYSVPLGAKGWRGTVGYAKTRYVLGRDFAGSEGTAKVSSVGARYALLRSLRSNVMVSATLQEKKLYNYHDPSGMIEQYSSRGLPVVLQFDHIDSWGSTVGGLTWTEGSLDKDDAVTRGHFRKVELDLIRYQDLTSSFSLFGRFRKQTANKNLDSSERMSLGGATGVRAYAASEGFGDEGWLAQLELRYAHGDAMLYAFYDHAHIRVNAQPDLVELPSPNVKKAGAGFGMRYQAPKWVLDTSLAWRTQGGVPTSEGSRDPKPRAWVNWTYRF